MIWRYSGATNLWVQSKTRPVLRHICIVNMWGISIGCYSNNVNVSMIPRDILIHQLSRAVSVEGEDGKSETWTLLTSNMTPRLSAELKSMTNIRNRHFTQSCMYCTKPLTHSLFIVNVTPFI